MTTIEHNGIDRDFFDSLHLRGGGGCRSPDHQHWDRWAYCGWQDSGELV